MLDFVSIDFETANECRSSPCSVGVVVVQDGKEARSFYTLIRPRDCRFSPLNTGIHGIAAQDVRHAPEFPAVWPTLRALIEGPVVVAHNASFDMGVLRATLTEYGLEFPRVRYACTRAIAKAAWPGLPSYRLPMVCRTLGIELRHHNALEDARACAGIAKRAMSGSGAATLDELLALVGLCCGEIDSGGSCWPAGRATHSVSRKTARIGLSASASSGATNDPHQVFAGSVVVFTGSLRAMGRRQAIKVVVDSGGEVDGGVTKRTRFLVAGDHDPRKLARGSSKSSKLRKAESLAARGQEIQILSEEDFLRMLGM